MNLETGLKQYTHHAEERDYRQGVGRGVQNNGEANVALMDSVPDYIPVLDDMLNMMNRLASRIEEMAQSVQIPRWMERMLDAPWNVYCHARGQLKEYIGTYLSKKTESEEKKEESGGRKPKKEYPDLLDSGAAWWDERKEKNTLPR
ncbi:hypothetical protein JW930_00215 [Candidatus Woesearchaeota archaeon]|nr:hypothetical protein [Candidatus Woesearchaeota archaeon]